MEEKSKCSERMSKLKLSNDADEEDTPPSPSTDFTLYGSPAPRSTCRSSSVRKNNAPVQSPKMAKTTFQAKKTLKLPVDKILMLNERMEKAKKDKVDAKLAEDESVEDVSECVSPTFDLSIDLSSVAHSNAGSESSSEERDEISSQPPSPIRGLCSTPTSADSVSEYLRWKGTQSRASLGPSYRSSNSVPCDRPAGFNRVPQTATNHPTKYSRLKSADLVHIYVSSVDDQRKLTRYFRPCHVCREACCLCVDTESEAGCNASAYSALSRRTGVTGLPLPYEHEQSCKTVRKTEPRGSLEDLARVFKTCTDGARPEGEGGSEITRGGGSRPETGCSEFSNFLLQGYMIDSNPATGKDSGTGTLQVNDLTHESDVSAGAAKGGKKATNERKAVLISYMQLAAAARYARILANSLESVLDIVGNDGEDSLASDNLFQVNELVETLSDLTTGFRTAEDGVRKIETNVDDDDDDRCDVHLVDGCKNLKDHLGCRKSVSVPHDSVPKLDVKYEDEEEVF